MHRLFVAIRLPRAVRERLLAIAGGVFGVRWQTDDQLHLTLRFVGDVDRHGAEDVAAALLSVNARPFDVALIGGGRFGEGTRAGSLWIGVAPHESLVALHKKIDAACRRAGVPSERRAYLPHITVGRFGRTAGLADAFLERAAAATGAPFTIDSFGLYESRLGSEGAAYELVERYRFG